MSAQEGSSALVAEVEAYIRKVAAGADPNAETDEEVALRLEAVLQPYAKYVRHHGQAKIGDWYVGRPTLWGNRRKLPRPATDEDRRRVVLAYAREFARRSVPQRRMMLGKIQEVLSRGVKLVCWCSPRLCHAQVLAYWALTGRDPLAPEARR